MGWGTEISEILKTASTNKRAAILLIFFVIIGSALFFSVKYFTTSSKTVEVSKPGQCDYLQKQNEILISALLDIRNRADSLTKNSGHAVVSRFSNLSLILPYLIDTVKRPKQKMQQQQRQHPTNQQYQQQMRLMIKDIDSILLKAKQIKKTT